MTISTRRQLLCFFIGNHFVIDSNPLSGLKNIPCRFIRWKTRVIDGKNSYEISSVLLLKNLSGFPWQTPTPGENYIPLCGLMGSMADLKEPTVLLEGVRVEVLHFKSLDLLVKIRVRTLNPIAATLQELTFSLMFHTKNREGAITSG